MNENEKDLDEMKSDGIVPDISGDEPKTDSTEESAKPEINNEWKFDGEAPTLADNFIDNGEIEISIPKAQPVPAPAAAPAAATVQKKPKIKNKDTLKFVFTAIIMVIVIAVLAFLGVRYYTVPNSNEKMNPGNVALTVGDTDVSIGMYNYYYSIITQNYIQYANYGYYQLDTTTDYSKQKTTDSNGKQTTWANLFVSDTVNQIQYITSYYEKAVKEGVTLTKDQKSSINEQLKSLKESASAADKSVDEYISETYGEHCGYATLKKMLEQCYIAENYFQKHQVETKVDEKEIDEYYKKNKDNYSEISFAYLQLPFEEKTKADVQKKAEKYASQIKNVKQMKKLIPTACKSLIDQYVSAGYFENAEECAKAIAESVETSITKSDTSFGADTAKWLFDSNTKKGECTSITDEENSIVYVVLKTGDPAVQDEEVYSVRHILITPESKSDSEDDSSSEDTQKEKKYTEEEWQAAEKEAEKILDEFNSGKKTEYEFALLAEKYSDDTESTSKGSSNIFGGLCAGSKLGQMVSPFEKWSIDKSRKYGDTDIVKSDFGYHIMFFINDTQYYKYQCETKIKQQKEDDFVKSASVKKHAGAMKKTKVAEPTAASDATSQADNQISNVQE